MILTIPPNDPYLYQMFVFCISGGVMLGCFIYVIVLLWPRK